MKKRLALKKGGFSLIELIVAMGIIGVGLLGIASLAAQNVRVQYFNRNSLISSQLAQEGLELARNQRDNNWKSSSPKNWVDLYYPGFIIDYELSPQPFNSITETPLLSINSSGFYGYGSGEQTAFRRFLTSDCSEKDRCLVTCYVSWQAQGQSGAYQSESYIYDWNK